MTSRELVYAGPSISSLGLRLEPRCSGHFMWFEEPGRFFPLVRQRLDEHQPR